jgi:hypothetical protein
MKKVKILKNTKILSGDQYQSKKDMVKKYSQREILGYIVVSERRSESGEKMETVLGG